MMLSNKPSCFEEYDQDNIIDESNDKGDGIHKYVK